MIKKIAKGISLLLILTFLVPSNLIALAEESAVDDYEYDYDLESITEELPNLDVALMTIEEKELYDELVDVEIQKEELRSSLLRNGTIFDEQEFKNDLDMLFTTSPKARAINIKIKNNIIAAGINVAIGMLVGGAGLSAVQSYIRKKGTEAAKRMLYKTIVTKLTAWGAGKLAVGLGVAVNFILAYLDPGSKIAKWLDSKDIKPNNGYLNFRI